MLIRTNTYKYIHAYFFSFWLVLVWIMFVVYKPIQVEYIPIHANTYESRRNPNTNGGKTRMGNRLVLACIWYVFGLYWFVLCLYWCVLVCIAPLLPIRVLPPFWILDWYVLACIGMYCVRIGMYFACIKISIQTNTCQYKFWGTIQSNLDVI